MRTTVDLEDDVAAALRDLRRKRSVGLSQAVNELIRRGLAAPRKAAPFRQRSEKIGIRIDVTNVAEALEQLEGPTSR